MSDYERPEETTPPAPAATPPPSVPAPPPPPPEPEAAVEAVDVLPPAQRGPRWVGFVTSVGLALTVVVGAQVLAAIAEGLSLKKTEPQGVPGDIFHRLGYAFSNLGGTVLLFLVVAVVLVSLPVFLERRTTDRQETAVSVTLGLTVVLAVIIGVGSILTVRYNLHLYSANKRSVPSFVRIQLVFFLLGALGTAAIALFSALTALGLRDKGDHEPEPVGADAS
jgi:cytochrome bd-type quinol oxidase subunit 2